MTDAPRPDAPDLAAAEARRLSLFLDVALFDCRYFLESRGGYNYVCPVAPGEREPWTRYRGKTEADYPPLSPADYDPHRHVWTKPPNYLSADGAEAVIGAMKGRPFSTRRRFGEALCKQATTPGGIVVAWPDALFYLAGRWPLAVAHAAVLALWPTASPEARALLTT